MSKKTGYKKAPKHVAQAIEKAEVVRDFLPSPEKLVFKEHSLKITLFLSTKSVKFFKKKATETHVSYQKMIKRVLDLYVDHFQD